MTSSEDAVLDGLWERGRRRWPSLEITPSELATYVRERVAESIEWPGLHAEDLYLACACVLQRAGAADAFAREFREALALFSRRIEPSAEVRSERGQELLVQLVVGDGSAGPKLAGYSGRGPLTAWLRMVVMRRSLTAARDRQRHAEAEERLAREAADSIDPEMSIIRQRYAREFEEAFRQALVQLHPPARALLRLHYAEELPLETIASLHGWSKATASRRIADARAAILDGACRILSQQLNVTSHELESLLRVMRSGLDLGLLSRLR
jgi:RNA polymerase sigma-70 factor (ECF subfamily)